MTVISDTLWTNVLLDLQSRIGNQEVFQNYISDLKLKSVDQKMITILAPNSFCKTIVNNKYSKYILEAIHSVTETDYKINILTEDDLPAITHTSDKKSETPFPSFQQFTYKETLTFDNFVVGKSNDEAYKSSRYVTDHPGDLNPLFIYSKSGLGKTHLLHAIGNAYITKNPLKKVIYTTAQDFVDEYVDYSIKRDKDPSQTLKNFFKEIDLLLIDDIQFLAKKTKTCETFFHIFNTLVAANKQIVITSDCAPKDLEGLEERLVSRFASGLTSSIKELDQETLIEILKLKIKINGNNLDLFDEDVLAYLAKNNSSNVRVLEGSLNRLVFYNEFLRNTGRITLKIAKEAFDEEETRSKKNKTLTPERIIDQTASYYALASSQVLSKVRTFQVALARHISIYLCRTLLDIPFAQIGRTFSKDHTTIMSSVTKVENLLKDDPGIQKAVATIKKQLKV